MPVKPSIFGTAGLEFKDYTVLDPTLTGRPIPITQTPLDASGIIKGFVLGTASEFAHLAKDVAVFNQRPNSTTFPFYGGALTVPTGESFRVHLAPGQTLWGLGSIAMTLTNGVWVSFNMGFYAPELFVEETPLEDERFVGPRPFFRKR